MRMKKPKMATVMKEFGSGKLRSGSKTGKKVTNPKQAIAIGLSEARRNKGDEAMLKRKKMPA